MNVTAFGAHPDDIEIFISGTMKKYMNQGHNLTFVIATDYIHEPNVAEIRRNEASNSAKLFGIEPIFMGYEDGNLLNDIELITSIKMILLETQTDIIFTHHYNDYHADHRNLSSAICSVSQKPIFMSDTFKGINFTPQFYVDITAEFKFKMNCIAKHESQLKYKYMEIIELQNRFRCLQSGKRLSKYAEAYECYNTMYSQNAYLLLPK